MTDNKRNDVNRNIGLDIIRCIAILFVISCHFFLLNTSLREVPFHGISLFIQATVLSLMSDGSTSLCHLDRIFEYQ